MMDYQTTQYYNSQTQQTTMTYREINMSIKGLLRKKMRVLRQSPSDTANFFDDYGLSKWEINLLLYNVEDHFNIRLRNGLEDEIHTINQLVNVIHNEKQRQVDSRVNLN